MRITELLQAQSLKRALVCLDAHADILGVVNGTELRKTLETSVVTIDAAATAQGARQRDKLGEAENQRTLERGLTTEFLNPVAKFASVELVGVPNFRALMPETRHLTGERLVLAAQSVMAAAAPYVEHFVEGHFPTDFFVKFADATKKVQASFDLRQAQNMQQVNATKAVGVAVKAGRAAVRRIHPRVMRLAAGNGPLLEEWRVAKRVTAKTGRTRTNNKTDSPPVEKPASAPEVAPVSPATSAPATEGAHEAGPQTIAA